MPPANTILPPEAVEKNIQKEDVKPSPRVEEKQEAICRRDQVWDRQGRRTHLVKTSQRSRNYAQKYSRYVLLVRRIFSDRGTYVNTEIDVKGTELQKVLREIHKDTKGISLHENPPTVKPNFFYLSREQLRRYADTEDARATQDRGLGFEINAALTYIGEEFASLDRTLTTMLDKKEITFQHIWAIMPPNVLVFTMDALREPRVYRARKCEMTRLQNGAHAWFLECEGLDFNGTKLGRVSEDLMIPQFEGAVGIEELPVYPFHYHSDEDAMKKTLLDRAEKALSLYSSHHLLREYSGHGLQESDGDSLQGKLRRFNSHGRIMIDPKSLETLKPKNRVVPGISGSILPDQLTGNQKLTLSSMVYGFSFGDKVWGAFATSRVGDVAWNDEMYKALVMPELQKRLIFQLVKAHGSNRTGFDDFVRDKGKGLIGLLMGAPGLGKSLTAEAIAETARKPLYMMSSGELGEHVTAISNNLASVLELTTAWKAVLLIDEADVFMAKRSEYNLERNAVTSIFLRHLEYYPGILILTTNRAESFDPAFQSMQSGSTESLRLEHFALTLIGRIHFCHRYDELNADARKYIWNNFMAKAQKDENIEVVCDEKSLEKLSKLNFNGRQIKNAMSIALTLAMIEQKPLTAEDIANVSKSLQDFNLVGSGRNADELFTLSRRSTDLLGLGL